MLNPKQLAIQMHMNINKNIKYNRDVFTDQKTKFIMPKRPPNQHFETTF